MTQGLDHIKAVVRNLGPDVLRAEVLWAADLHVGSELHDAEGWRALLRWLKEGEHRYCILGGDLMEAATRDSKSDVYKAKLPPQAEMEQLAEDLEAIRDRVLLVIGGNHEERIWRLTGVDPLAWVCHAAGVEYARDGGFVVVRLGRHSREGKDRPITYTLYASHGWTGARRPGGVVNAMQEASLAVVADVYLFGHSHRPVAFPEQRVYLNDYFRPQAREVWFVSCGSLLRWGGYVQRSGRVWSGNHMPVITLDGKRHRVQVTMG